MTPDSGPDPLGRITGVLAVVAHPDDESFGLGAVLSELVIRDARAGLICFTHGECSTLHSRPGDLSVVRAQAAQAAARASGLPVLAWALPRPVAQRLNAELGTTFTGRDPGELDVTMRVSRDRQWRAIARHRSQAIDNPMLRRRLDLLGDHDYHRLIHPPTQKGNHTMSYGITVRLPAPFAPTVERVRAALKEQGFGVLTEIDVQAAFGRSSASRWRTTSSSAPATHRWRTGRWTPTATSACCCPATSSSAPTARTPPSCRPWTRRSWSRSPAGPS